jgi:hypothetical protein
MNIKTLCHGSNAAIENPEFGKGNPYNDYGIGFTVQKTLNLRKNGHALIKVAALPMFTPSILRKIKY